MDQEGLEGYRYVTEFPPKFSVSHLKNEPSDRNICHISVFYKHLGNNTEQKDGLNVV